MTYPFPSSHEVPLRNSFLSASLLLGLIALGGCNTTSQEPQISAPMQPSAMAAANATVMSSNLRLSGGSDCASVVSDWQAIQDNDLRMGHVHPSVYALISKDIAMASTACSSGRDAEARALVQASRARHGYPN
ncbi:MAG: hypothetical protein EBY21_12975 [Alphaproteobacteria bacterium]|nr:hypothetical protein [Alphaproteobacteria bacterium]